MPASPTRAHQIIASRLMVALEEDCPDEYDVTYLETGRWTKFVETGEPFPVNLPISRITPRHL